MIIIKIGGGKLINLGGIIKGLSELDEQLFIVHGANALRDELCKDLGFAKKVVESISGYSSVFSDRKAIDLLMMAYAGLRNKRIVELCQQNGINAIGLTGIDGRSIQGKRNPGIKMLEGKKKKIIRDFSGKPKTINLQLFEMLIKNNYTPVVSVPIIDETNVAINSENDDIISVIQMAFNAKTIIQLIEAPGFLEDSNKPETLQKKISKEELTRLEEKSEGRFKRKLLALKKILDNSSPTIIIGDGRTVNPIRDILEGGGTLIK